MLIIITNNKKEMDGLGIFEIVSRKFLDDKRPFTKWALLALSTGDKELHHWISEIVLFNSEAPGVGHRRETHNRTRLINNQLLRNREAPWSLKP